MPDNRGRDDYWDLFEGQTRLKHYVLNAYLDRWSRVLIQSGQKRLWFVDAFAGRGRDNEHNPGSPIIARNIAKKIEDEFPGAEIRIVAIEADPNNFRELELNLADDCGPNGCATLFEGTLDDHIETVMLMLGTDPALFFLDPWGVKGLSATVTERLLNGDKREVLVLFDDDGAARVHASAKAQPKDKKKPTQSMSLFGDDDLPEQPPAKREQSPESRARSAKATEAVIREVFGVRWPRVEARIHGLTGVARRDALLDEYIDLLSDLKATHVLPFSVRDGDDKHHYYLVHASQHRKAFTVMKDAIRRALNQRDDEPGVRRNLFFQTAADVGQAVGMIERHFAGQSEVRWQDGKRPGTVLVFAEEETDLLYGDMVALKEELERRGYVVKVPGKKALMYSFPETAM